MEVYCTKQELVGWACNRYTDKNMTECPGKKIVFDFSMSINHLETSSII